MSTLNPRVPREYIKEVFETKDIVFLAEHHAVKENLDFVHSIVDAIYDAGVRFIGMEFGASEDQEALDKLVTGEKYDQTLARELMFNYNVIHPYKEYYDLYRTVYLFNKSLPKGSTPLRILNLSYKYNWEGYTPPKTPEKLKKVFHKGNTETYRTEIVKKEIIDKNQKILILTGNIHAWTKYKYPVVDYLAKDFISFEDRTFGCLVHQLAPEKTYTILFHEYFTSKDIINKVSPANGEIERLLKEKGLEDVAFDLNDSYIGDLSDDSFYSIGYNDFKMKNLADGYIYHKPLNQRHACTVDKDFIKSKTLAKIQKNFPDPEWHPVPKNFEEYHKVIQDYVSSIESK